MKNIGQDKKWRIRNFEKLVLKILCVIISMTQLKLKFLLLICHILDNKSYEILF